MKKLALPILVFALLGIASMFVPGRHGSLFGLYAEFDTPRLTLLLLSFLASGVAAGLALRKVRPWHGYVALGGFALAMVKARAWTALQHFSDAPVPMKLQAIAIAGGVIFTLLATAVPERESIEATS
jgi:hypothetical protein